MRLIETGETFVAVELEPKDQLNPNLRSYKGAHTDDESAVVTIARRCNLAGNGNGWTWHALGSSYNHFVVIRRKDYEALTPPEENEWGLVTP